MREFAPWADEEALSASFADIDELAAGCRFSDCRHETEPGCAVLAAAESEPGVAARLASWRALQRELAWLARRNDARLMAEECAAGPGRPPCSGAHPALTADGRLPATTATVRSDGSAQPLTCPPPPAPSAPRRRDA